MKVMYFLSSSGKSSLTASTEAAPLTWSPVLRGLLSATGVPGTEGAAGTGDSAAVGASSAAVPVPLEAFASTGEVGSGAAGVVGAGWGVAGLVGTAVSIRGDGTAGGGDVDLVGAWGGLFLGPKGTAGLTAGETTTACAAGWGTAAGIGAG